MALRGERLREHILWTAKDVFIELGFERTSMDVVAARAKTSKRSLYAHFENKDKLFGAVMTLVRELYLGKLLRTPAEYGDDPAEAIARFCGRLLQVQLWNSALRTLRLGIAEAERLPGVAAEYYESIFEIPQQRLADFVVERYGVDTGAAHEIAQRLLGRAVYPVLIGALLGVGEPLAERPEESTLETDVDLEPLRAAVAALLPPLR
ncbi:TetR/AcrR family transcriptional regulator [Amycolatopsis pigmentata]|uniref:TetR/AcrR family transcriptional regulator n=1 Tax=Amycolatopsis pigmentata TaxID=450801 RepID=A0ABW5G483_9PSEU